MLLLPVYNTSYRGGIVKSLACQHLLPLSVARPAKEKTVFLPSCFLLYDRQTAVGNKTLYQDIVISPFFVVSWGTSRIVFFFLFGGILDRLLLRVYIYGSCRQSGKRRASSAAFVNI